LKEYGEGSLVLIGQFKDSFPASVLSGVKPLTAKTDFEMAKYEKCVERAALQ
jgi:hypothetical protein